MEKRPISDWYAESLRFTTFMSEDDEDLPLTQWWVDATGNQPDQVVSKPKERQAIVAGSLGEGMLSLEHQPLRIDLKLQPSPRELSSVSFMPNVGEFDAVCTAFIRTAQALIREHGFPSVRRMAYGAVLQLPMENREKAYQQMQMYLPAVRLDATNSSDFLYRINRPRQSRLGITGLSINRLNQWSVIAFRLFVGPSVPPNALPERYSCRLELDVNTAADFLDELPDGKLNDILNELVGVAKEIACNGDT